MKKMGEFEFSNEAAAELRDKSILESLHKILQAEASRVSLTVPGYDITAYDMKNGVIRIDIKLIH